MKINNSDIIIIVFRLLLIKNCKKLKISDVMIVLCFKVFFNDCDLIGFFFVIVGENILIGIVNSKYNINLKSFGMLLVNCIKYGIFMNVIVVNIVYNRFDFK